MTVREWLEGIASTTMSTEKDSQTMEGVLHRAGFPQARVVCGIVYLEGKGTMEAPPTDIHSIAKMILSILPTSPE